MYSFYYVMLIFLIRFIISHVYSKKEQSLDRKKALYLYWFVLLFLNIFYPQLILRFTKDVDFLMVIIMLISIIIPFRLYIDFKDSYKEENQKRAGNMVKGIIVAFVMIIIAFIKDDRYLSIFYLRVACTGYILGMVLALALILLVKIGEFFSKHEDKIIKTGKEVATATKNEISKIGSKTEYEVNVLETEELKVETKIDEENLTIERNVEYEKNRLVIIEEKTRSLIDRIFNRKK